MCGIAGFVNLNSHTPDKFLIKRMTDVISHRGPDDEGQEISKNAALGNRRLAIIDLSVKGHMPMWDSKHRYCITYNGEVYNYRSLRQILDSKGHKFQSNSDTEVILNLFVEYKEKSVSMLRGMFAFAIWDSFEQSLFLARDQFGIKPLHYYQDRDVFIFASEIKSILHHPNVKRRINHEALSQYFSIGFGAVPSPLTMFEGIFKLKPAHYAALSQNKLNLYSYWQPSTKTIPIEEKSAIEKGIYLIENSVKEQLVSDVPLGTFLSGGLDSSLITALSQRHTKGSINTFSIGFEDPKFDESKYALQVAKHLKTNHHHQIFTPKEMLEVLPEVVGKLDEPLADASILPTYLLSKFTRQQVTVALSGDGGDELFLGYPTYIVHKVGFALNKLPTNILKTLHKTSLASSGLLQVLPFAKHSPNYNIKYKLDRLFKGLNKDLAKQYLNVMGPFNLKLKDKLVTNHKEAAVPFIKNIIESSQHDDGLSIIQLLDFLLYLSEDCLVKTDRASNFNSLEVRPPLLDVEVAEYALTLPTALKLNGFTPKYILKKIAQKYLPNNIINRPKKGFGIPLDKWLNNELNSDLHRLLDARRIQKQGLFDFSYVNQLVSEHEKGIADHRMVLWNLFMFESWYDHWMN